HNRCFEQVIPRSNALQDAARYQPIDRSYQAKYPGHVGHAVRACAQELLGRVAEANTQEEEPQLRTAV
ncbi:MAG: hypothetical protein ACREC6_08255, partial [Hyphomicrobiaceae bacterium]